MADASLPLFQTRSWLQAIPDPDTSRVRLSAAHDEWNHVCIALAALTEGFFAQEGLRNVELVTLPEDSGELLSREAMQVELLANGNADVGIDPRTTFVLEANSEGRPVCIVAARRKTHAFVLFGRPGMQTIDDLRGQRLCQSMPGGATDVMLRQVLTDSGIDPERDVHIEYSGGAMHDSAGTGEGFRAGTHGAAILVTYRDQIEGLRRDGFPLLADLRTRYPSRHDRCTAANQNFAQQHPELVKGFCKGMIRACNWVLDLTNAARFKEIVIEAGYLKSKREQDNFDGLFLGWQDRVSRDLALPRDGIDLIVDEEMRAGRLPASYSVDQVLSLGPLKMAHTELGIEE
ncbi:MAG: hypothetical protein GEU73_10830 [Chloroflexi bacterium]|nr:hypothetical protein [Chloroflexota bacterium]